MESKEMITVEKEVYESVLRVNCNKIAECERLQKQLDIALECMRVIKRNSSYRDIRHSLIVVAEHKIKELDND